MADATAPLHPRLVLLADAQEWSARSLSSILAPHGYQVAQFHNRPELVAAARTRPGDAILLAETLPDADLPSLIRALREDPLVPQELPIVGLASGAVPRPKLVAALRAGVTDFWRLPMDAEELVLRLGALVRAKLVVERIREEALFDAATGLYNRRGLAVRARDLASQADRRRGPLACVVLAPAVEDARARRHAAALDMDTTVDAMADCLKRSGRTSDAIGRLAFTEFAVLAPDTDARGARLLGTRLGHAIALSGASTQSTRPPRVRAGYHAVSDFHASGLGALDLIARATTALRAIQGTGGKGWIQAYEPGTA